MLVSQNKALSFYNLLALLSYADFTNKIHLSFNVLTYFDGQVRSTAWAVGWAGIRDFGGVIDLKLCLLETTDGHRLTRMLRRALLGIEILTSVHLGPSVVKLYFICIFKPDNLLQFQLRFLRKWVTLLA